MGSTGAGDVVTSPDYEPKASTPWAAWAASAASRRRPHWHSENDRCHSISRSNGICTTQNLQQRCKELLTLAGSVTLVEALDAAASIDELLLAGEVRMALVAQFKAERASASALREKNVSARALHGDIGVNGVDVGLHDDLQNRTDEK